ncbi:NCA2-domain-containing protein [Phellopilus nigrolimitatus]|nr:NCA2-domain-containing protein [Phellopilus nigrolimitatus]
MSSFAANHVRSLVDATKTINVSIQARDTTISVSTQRPRSPSPRRAELYSLLRDFPSPLDKSALRTTLKALSEREELKPQTTNLVSASAPEESEAEDLAIETILESRLVVGLYAETLDLWLKEASDADSEAEWWSGTARSWQSVASYLLATLPERLQRSFHAILHAMRSRNLPLRPSSFTPQSLRNLFPRSLRPTALATAFFPHLYHQPHLLFTSPFELARQECQLRQEKLIKLRDERAEQLGGLLSMESELGRSIRRQEHIEKMASRLQAAVEGGEQSLSGPLSVYSPESACHRLAFKLLPAHASAHGELFASLRRPSRLTLLWPRLVLLPPALFVLLRLAYDSRQSIAESVLRSRDTFKGFWFGYVLEPLEGILNTVRTGGDDSARIVSQEAVRADIASLERMAVALSKDKLSLSDSQLHNLSEQIRQGDLTPVLRIYEEDIRSPIRAAVSGTLVRSLLIQIQKAKVDLDQALSGIDKLLKSQELTFAFVGVAPALTVVYAAASYARSIWSGGRGRKRLGGKRRRESAWLAIRHVERLLLTNPGSESTSSASSSSSAPGTDLAYTSSLTSGLLLIALARLRTYAEANLPAHSLLREGVLADVADLENPVLGRAEKLRVVERMWRSWGSVLGWDCMGRT